MIIKNVPMPNAFVQVASFQVVPGFEISGIAKIYTDAQQAQNIENAIDQIIVVTIDDIVTDYKQQLYNELVQDARFSNMTSTPDIPNIVTTGMQRFYLRQPTGYFDASTNTATRFI
jgi:tagatose-1,6-bisphosphate aldolase non-catalytic subunit AgaZ/GatZ